MGLWCYFHRQPPLECGGPHDRDGKLVVLRQLPKQARIKVKPSKP